MAQGKDVSGTESKRITDPQNSSRRRAVKTIAGGITALAAYQYLPAKWEKPILESIYIPAHAQTSGALVSSAGASFGVGVIYAGSLSYKESIIGTRCLAPENIEVDIVMNVEPDIAAVKVFAHVYIETILEYRYLDKEWQPFYARGKSTLNLNAKAIDEPEGTKRGSIYGPDLYIEITEMIPKTSDTSGYIIENWDTSANITVKIRYSNIKAKTVNPLCLETYISYSGTLIGKDTDKII